MEIKRAGSPPSQTAPAVHFTGTMRLDPLCQAREPGRVGVALTPALRTAFEGIGSSGFESTTDGFVCRRATEAARKGT
jgi:hypothetical protein